MDAAAKNFLKTTSLFLATALLLAVPGRAQSLLVSSTAVGLSGNQAQAITVSSSGANITYSLTGKPFWVNVSSDNNFATPDTLRFQINTTNCGATLPCTGTVTLHPANSSGDVNITVTYNNTGGGGTGTITASPGSVNMSVAGVNQSTSTNVFLSSTTSVTITNITSSQSWLTASASPQVVNGQNTSTLTISANSFGLTVGSTNTGTITITPSTGTQTQIGVTFTVGTGTNGGTLTVSPGSFAFATPNGTQSASVSVGSNSSSVNSFNFVATSQSNWLLFDNNITGSGFIGQHSISVNSAALSQLSNTTYNGTVVLTNPFNFSDTTTISVTLAVNGGTGGTLTVSPPSLLYTVAPSSASQTQNLIVNNPGGGTVTAVITSNNGGFLTVSSVTNCNGTPNPTLNCSFTGSQTLAFTVNPLGLIDGGFYTGTVQLQSGATSVTVNVNLTVTSSVGPLIVNPTALTFSATGGSSSQTQNLFVEVTNNAAVQASIQQSNLGSFFTVSPLCNVSSCSFNGTQNLTVTVNPANLAAGFYSGSISLLSGGTSVTVPVNLTVTGSGGGGGGGGGSNGGIVSPTSLSFAYQTGKDPNLPPQAIIVAPAGSFTVSTSVNTSQQWLFAAAQGSTGPNRVTVTVSPQGLAAGAAYQGTITINTSAGVQTVNVSLAVTNGPVLEVNPGTYNNFYQAGQGQLQPQFFLFASDNSAMTGTLSTTTSWITIPVASVGPTQTSFAITLNPTGLCNGLNTGSFTITSAGAANSPITVPVVLLVSGSSVTTGCSSGGGGNGPLTFTQSSLTFNTPVGGTPATQTLGVTAPTSSTSYSVSFSTQSGGTGWLSVFPTGSVFGNQNLSVSANAIGLGAGTYNGSITFNTNGVTQTVPVSLVVGSTGGGVLSVSSSALNFSFTPGGSTPAGQTLTVTAANGVNTSFSYSAVSTGNFLSAIANGGTVSNNQIFTTPTTFTINVNPSGLTPGQTYSGTITLTAGNGSATTVGVTLTIANASVLTVTPTSLSFTYNAGDPAPSTQSIQVAGAQGLTFTAVASSSGNWLSVSPTSGAIGASPTNLTVSVNPAGLNAQTYSGTIVVPGTGSATGSTTVNVTLTVNAPRPTITSVASAASYVGGSISPGELITIFGTSIGPSPGVTLALDPATGKVATTLGGVQVLVNGFLAPMVFASNTQVSAVVPYEVAGGPGTIGNVVVKFLGQPSNGIGTPVTSALPGIFTLNASGSGPGAILNPNLSGNSPANPANKGDTVAIYMTGEGLTSPAGVTGKVTTVSSTGPLTPVPLLPVGALIDGAPAAISFAGEAPGLVSGVLQVNVQIPPGARSGPLPLIISIGGVNSQAGVTVSVR